MTRRATSALGRETAQADAKRRTMIRVASICYKVSIDQGSQGLEAVTSCPPHPYGVLTGRRRQQEPGERPHAGSNGAMSAFHLERLDNGLRTLTSPMDSAHSVTCAIMLAAGSRYETPQTNGIAQFAETMFSK